MSPASNYQIILECLSEAESLSNHSELLAVLAQIPPQQKHKIDFSNYRISSHTLGQSENAGPDLQRLENVLRLIKANRFNFEDSEDLFLINQLILGNEIGGLRTECLLEPYAFPDPKIIPEGLAILLNFQKTSTTHPFVKLVAYIQGLLSLHPFTDGNHRTCRLILDSELVKLGLPPVTVRKSSDLLMANAIDKKVFSLADALQTVLHGIGETLRLGM